MSQQKSLNLPFGGSSLRGQYQSLDQEEHEELPTQISPSPLSIEVSGNAGRSSVASKKRNVWFILGGSLLVLAVLGILAFSSINNSSQNIDNVDMGSSHKSPKRSDDDSNYRGSPVSYFEECRSHCSDACIKTPVRFHKPRRMHNVWL